MQQTKKPLSHLVFVIVVAVLLCAGCKKASTTGKNKAANTKPAVSDVATSVEAIVKSGAELKKNGVGNVLEADFRGVEMTPELANELGGLKSVRNVRFNDTLFDDTCMGSIAELTSLTHLDLRGCPVTDKSMEYLAGLANLRSLRFSGKSGQTDVTDDSMAIIGKLPKLKLLAIDFLKFAGSPEGFAELKSLQSLEEIYASNTLLGDEALETIATQFPNLKKLRASGCQVSDEGLKSIAKLTKLEELDLSENTQIFDTGLEHIAGMTQLKKLNLWRVPITDEGVKSLAGLTNLEWLNLDNVLYLSDEALPNLKAMNKLKFLHLGSTAVTDEGMPHLAGLTSLDDLKVTRTNVTQAGVDELKKTLTKTAVQLKYEGGEK